MAKLQMIDGGHNGYTAVQVISSTEYERIEVYGVYRYPARLLDPTDDPTIFLDTSRPYRATDTDLLYRAYGINECQLYQIGEITAEPKVGYKEDSVDGKVWDWYPSSYNLLKNSDSLSGESYKYFSGVSIETPQWFEVMDTRDNWKIIRNRQTRSETFEKFKMARISAPAGAQLMSFVVRPKQAFQDIFVPFGASEFNLNTTKLHFAFSVGMDMDVEPIPGGYYWNEQWDYSVYPAVVVFKHSNRWANYAGFQVDVLIDGILTTTQNIIPTDAVDDFRETFMDFGTGRLISIMRELTIDVNITASTQEVELRISRLAGTLGSGVNYRFRNPLVRFNDPPSQPLASRSLTDETQHWSYDRDIAPNNIVFAKYPYTSLGAVRPLASISEEPYNSRYPQNVQGVEHWHSDANVYAKINGYDLAVMRNYRLQNMQNNPFRQFIWGTQPIRLYPRDNRLKDKDGLAPIKIKPMWNPLFELPGSKVEGLIITPPVGTYIATGGEPSWTPIPEKSAKVYDPDGLLASSDVKLEGMQKEIFGDVSKIDFTQYKDLVYPLSNKALGRCNFVVPGYGEISDTDFWLLEGSFNEAMSTDSKVHTALNGFRQVYARSPKWEETSIRIAVVGRARAVLTVKALTRNPYFQIALDDQAQNYFDTFDDATFATTGTIKFEEWGKDTTRGPIVILEFDARRIVRPPMRVVS